MAGFQFTPYQPDTRSILELMSRGPAAHAAALRQGGAIRAQAAQAIGGGVAQSIGDLIQRRQQAPLLAEQAAARAQDRELRGLQIANERGQLTAQQQQADDRAVIDQVLQANTDLPSIEKAFAESGHGRLIPTIRKQFADAEESAAKVAASRTAQEKAKIDLATSQADYLANLATAVKAHDYDPGAFHLLIAKAYQHGILDQQQAGQAVAMALQQPDSIKAFIDARIQESPAQQKAAADQATRASTAANLAADNTRADAAAAETARHNKAMEARPVAGATGTNDVQLAIQGMKEGTNPPQMPGRASKDYTATLAEAKRQGYDLAGAVTDWNATQKHISTMNGAQQLRLTQSVNALPELLDSVDALASKWKGGRFPILNKANLAAAKNGVYGDDVASVARQLDTQIADVVADLGNVYMGGNSPTDHALSLAGKSLSGDWSEKVLHDMVKLAKGNVQIRQNSIRNTGVAGASAGNPYAPPQPTTPPPAAGGGAPTYQDYLKSRGGK